MKEREERILRALMSGPQLQRIFTHGLVTGDCSPAVTLSYLRNLLDRGYIEKQGRESYVITEAGQIYMENRPTTTPSRYYGNASMPPGSYVPPTWNVRSGGEQHKLHGSVGW